MKRFIFVLMLCLFALVVKGQTDVTAQYLKNYDFDTGFHYKAGATTEVKQEIKTIKNWTAGFTVDYTITGIYQYGFAGKFNGGEVPAKGYDGDTEGGALALSTGWGVSMTYYQVVTLPAGSYTISAPTYNGKSATKGTSELAWIPINGTTVKSTLNGYPSKQWTMDQISFVLTQATKGKIQIGYKAVDGGSGNSANLLIDYVKIEVQDMAALRDTLAATLSEAKEEYGDGTGREAAALKAVIDQAQAVYDNEEATAAEVIAADEALKNALIDYRWTNASETKPVNCTTYLKNPSFENGTTGWTLKGMSTQSNAVFTRKDGTYYLEAWVSAGNKISDVSALQTLTGLPCGNYRLTAEALHIQQTGSGSTTNSGSAQKGGYLVAGLHQTTVTSMKTYSVDFSVVDSSDKIEIGGKTISPTGNYFCLDDFHLLYMGEVNATDYANELTDMVGVGEKKLVRPMQDAVMETLQQALENARKALEGTGIDGEGNTTYDLEALTQARTTLLAAIEQAEASRQLYTTLSERISYAKKVYGWWKNLERKATVCERLTEAITTASEKVTDYTLTDAELKSATSTLNARISSVDKKIYCSGSACGSDAKLKDNDNQWSYTRSYQSKHWIIFWEKGYGDEVPSAVPSIMDMADKCFELYADKLGFITVNQGKSKTDTYKMIIRLYSTSEWKAEGSGIDNQIGMLSLSRWAYTSRGGQTVAHEIGHCFQYQVHCDNGDWNGWMYNWHNSTQNPFWEMCAQWMAYVYLPNKLLDDNEWLWNSLCGMHRHPLAGYLRYENFFIQNIFVEKHGWDAVGRLWNECRDPEDPFETYMRTRMTGTTAQKLDQLADEMWEWGARMTTFDFDAIRSLAGGKASWRPQTKLTKDSDGFFSPEKGDCIENYGNNAIKLNIPGKGKTVYAEFIGEAGKDGYNAYNVTKGGWKYGFVAFLNDGTRIYTPITTSTYDNPTGIATFECPGNVKNFWFVVSGAPTSYWSRDLINWGESTAEQWPYRVKFYQTNVEGNANNNGAPTGVLDMMTNQPATPSAVYDLQGRRIREADMRKGGLYIVNGKKVVK